MKLLLVSSFVLTALLVTSVKAADDSVVNIYSARKEALILPLLKEFKKETGVNFKLVTGKADALLKRLETEGELSPADVFITTDAGRLHRAKEAGVLGKLDNPKLDERVPENLRDSEKYWVGLSQRARTIIYAKDRANKADFSTYEDLSSDKWKGRICIRSSSNIYNQSLIASMIENQGINSTESWAKKVVNNFARKPAGGDTDQLRAVAAGQCDVAVANTYYFGRLMNSKKAKDQEVAGKLSVFWPNQGDTDRGVHINVSGAGITKHAKNVTAANRLLEYMLNDQSQKWYAEVNNEYPVVDGVAISDTLKSWGEFKSDSLNLTVLGKNNAQAVKLMDRAGWR